MSDFLERLKKFSKPASGVKHERKIIKIITKGECNALNQVIAPKIEQNRQERLASERQIHNDESVFKGMDGYDSKR